MDFAISCFQKRDFRLWRYDDSTNIYPTVIVHDEHMVISGNAQSRINGYLITFSKFSVQAVIF